MRLKSHNHKYKARACVIDGIKFASQKEGGRYKELKLLSAAGAVTDLELQPSFKLEVSGKLICRYIADFMYFDPHTTTMIVEDVKGYRTKEYRIKAKLFQALFPQYRHVET